MHFSFRFVCHFPVFKYKVISALAEKTSGIILLEPHETQHRTIAAANNWENFAFVPRMVIIAGRKSSDAGVRNSCISALEIFVR